MIDGTYDSYAGLRTAGWLTLVGSGLTGFALMLSSINECSQAIDRPCELMNGTLLWGGVAIAAGGGLGGFLMIQKKDEARVEMRGEF